MIYFTSLLRLNSLPLEEVVDDSGNCTCSDVLLAEVRRLYLRGHEQLSSIDSRVPFSFSEAGGPFTNKEQ